MKVYQEILKRVAYEGKVKRNRTGINTRSVFNINFELDILDGFPLVTLRRINFKAVVAELLWFLSGETHIRELQKHTKIWNPWAAPDGEVNSAYGYFWRHYPVHGYMGPGFDQIAAIRGALKTDPTSRRLVLLAWYPPNAWTSKLPPCHYTACFNVEDRYLNCHVTMRSADLVLGVPFNIASYALLTMLLASEANLLPGKLAFTLVDAHIYENHMPGVYTMLQRIPKRSPLIQISGMDEQWADEGLQIENFCLSEYNPHDEIRFEVAV